MPITLTQQQTSIGALASNGKAFDQTGLKRNKTAKNISLHYSLALRTINEVWWEDRNERASRFARIPFHSMRITTQKQSSRKMMGNCVLLFVGEKRSMLISENHNQGKKFVFWRFVLFEREFSERFTSNAHRYRFESILTFS